jgi:hypothetical protein
MRTLLIAAALVAAAAAQESSKTTGSISGTVKDATTGAPLAEVSVFIGGPAAPANAMTDSAGRYSLMGLAPGSYRVNVMGIKLGGLFTTKMVTLGAGQDLTSIDFPLQTFAEVSG